jgi:hypothetical protein
MSSVTPPKKLVGTAAARSWRPMPGVHWPWVCQVLFVDTSTTALGLGSLERRRIHRAIVEAGTPFAIRVTGQTDSSSSEFGAVAGWASFGARVTLLADQHHRSSWVCLSLGHRRVVLGGVETNLGIEAPIEVLGGADTATSCEVAADIP